MGFLGGEWSYRFLRGVKWRDQLDGSAYATGSKLEVLLGESVWDEIRGKTVIDFGCGTGAETVEMAQRGAAKVIGLDIVEASLEKARARAASANVRNCVFTTATYDQVDVVVCLDSFEHFADPAAVLRTIARLLKPGGRVLASFGPPWYHPYGGHLFSVFPWAHLVFTERALIRWRADFKTDGATRFSEVEGGLNQMSIRRMEKIIAGSPFRAARFELVPIRRARRFHNRLTREFLTSNVRLILVRPAVEGTAVEGTTV